MLWPLDDVFRVQESFLAISEGPWPPSPSPPAPTPPHAEKRDAHADMERRLASANASQCRAKARQLCRFHGGTWAGPAVPSGARGGGWRAAPPRSSPPWTLRLKRCRSPPPCNSVLQESKVPEDKLTKELAVVEGFQSFWCVPVSSAHHMLLLPVAYPWSSLHAPPSVRDHRARPRARWQGVQPGEERVQRGHHIRACRHRGAPGGGGRLPGRRPGRH